jgi:hypothetical protein
LRNGEVNQLALKDLIIKFNTQLQPYRKPPAPTK